MAEAKGTAAKLTPAMQQFRAAKKAHPECLLFFRMGDFYELFYEDAKTASKELGIALTSRSKGEGAVPMAGVPVKAYEQYLFKLIRRGYKVAICDQVEDPRYAKGLVDRAVTRIVSAGTLTEEELLDRTRNNFLLAVAPGKGRVGLAWIDLSTAEFLAADAEERALADELNRIDPAEILVPESAAASGGTLYARLRELTDAPLSTVEDWAFERRGAVHALRGQFDVATLEGLGLEEEALCVCAAGAVLHYLKETQRGRPEQIRRLRPYLSSRHLALDRASRRALELTANMRDGGRSATLLECLDYTATPMGSRRLRDWILQPSAELEVIRERQDGVEVFFRQPVLRSELQEILSGIFDVERITTKIVANRANARDLANLRQSIEALPRLRAALEGAEAEILRRNRKRLDALEDLGALLARAIADHPAALLHEGGIIREGYNEALDELRRIRSEGTDFIRRFQEREAERTGIANLKVGYNKVFGFYIEITNANKNLIPGDYIRKQTLKNAERYITPELKEYEVKVLNSEERAKDLEFELFQEVRARAAERAEALLRTAAAVAEVDVLCALAEAAARNRYVRPEVDDTLRIHVKAGRHPVLENLPEIEAFVPNDTHLDEEARFIILTGPNMAGKSTYLRQVSLIVLMAQMGAFVPAEAAEIGLVDRIFTRVGASDDLVRGNSTFMVEMVETAGILRNATERSLVILDEVGRGTSTFDGLSLAWAVSEHLAEKIRARTLFATHYHQLTGLEGELPGVKNLSTAVREWRNEIVFLRKIVEGGTDRSYGIHVARLAGIPDRVLTRAAEILRELETLSPDIGRCAAGSPPPRRPPAPRPRQRTLFPDLEKRLRAALDAVDPEHLTPVEALLKLKELKELLG